MSAYARSPPSTGKVHFTPQLEVDRFINTTEVSIWPCELPSEHSQLKNHISTSTKDIIYYVSSHEVFAIHLPTNRQELLASLDFKPTCIVSGHGWICMGGTDHGRCAFIEVQNHATQHTHSRSWSTEVDDSLSLDLVSPLRSSSHLRTTSEGGNPRRQRPKVIYEVIGSSIVNGITISRFARNHGLPDEIVAVISNNDKTVNIYSLTDQAVMKTIKLVTQINHASISPDGELLVAVGDINRVWFFQRSICIESGGQRSFDWYQIAVVHLASTVPDDWSFATAWSPSGHLCMVASQFGIITVFETDKIQKYMDFSSSVLHSIKSSRPRVCIPSASIPGAPRSMAFSPGPWDLVAWAEDHGRVTIADVRNDFNMIQTINVDVMSDKLEKIEYTSVPSTRELDQGRNATFIQRHHNAMGIGNSYTATQQAADYIEHAAMPRIRDTQQGNDPSQMFPVSPLNDSERGLIQLVADEHARETIEALNSARARPYSINYSGVQSTNSSGTAVSRPTTFSHFTSSRPEDVYSPRAPPQRRASVVMSQNTAGRANRTSTGNSLSPIPPIQLSTSPSRISESGNNDTEMQGYEYNPPGLDGSTAQNPTSITDTRQRHRRSTVEFLRQIRLGNHHGHYHFAEADRALREQARAWSRRIHELRERAGQLTERFDSFTNDDLSFLDEVTNEIVGGGEIVYRSMSSASAFIDGEVSIQGLGWSWDGRWLFVGTAKGIMRYKVNLPARTVAPKLQLA